MTAALIGSLEPTLPSSWYYDDEIFRREKDRIFFREWLCVGREADFAAAGDHRVLELLGESILLVRNREGVLRAFYNVCRHRGAQLCRVDTDAAPGRSAQGGIAGGRFIICPYHQWTYDLDGRLVSAPHLLQASAREPNAAVALYPVGVECWGGFIFLNLSPATAGSLHAQLGDIVTRLDRYPLQDLRVAQSIEYDVAANWKAICENYNECYHCAGVHPELCAVVPAFREAGGSGLDWSRGIPHRAGAYTFTHSGTTARRAFPALNADEQVRHKGELCYPNLFLSLSCDHVAAFILTPRAAERTHVTCHFLFEPHEIARTGFDPGDAAEFWDITNRQDWSICESVQRGLRSRVHAHGYYAPMEDASLDIRRYVQERLD